jgi:hypothetical protein
MKRRPSASGASSSASRGALEVTIRQARNAAFKQLVDAAPRFGIKVQKNTSHRLVTSDVATVAVTAVSDYDPAKLDEGTNAMFIYFEGGRNRNASIPRGFYVIKAFSGHGEGKPYGLLLDEHGKSVAKLTAVLEQKQTGSTLGVSGSIRPTGSNSVTICVNVEVNGQVYTACITIQ